MAEAHQRGDVTAVVVYRDPDGRFSFAYPDGWHRLALASDVGGVIVAPSPEGAATSFSVEVRDLGTDIAADDLPILREGFLAGLAERPGAQIEAEAAEAVGDTLALEARQRAGEPGGWRRWLRLYYRGGLQARLVAQGATEADFARWSPVFTTAMRSFRLGEWTADAHGQLWLPRPDRRPPAPGDAPSARP